MVTGIRVNGHDVSAGDPSGLDEIEQLRHQIEAVKSELQALRDLTAAREAEQRAALRQAVEGNRETLSRMDREHAEALRRVEAEAASEIVRLLSAAAGSKVSQVEEPER